MSANCSGRFDFSFFLNLECGGKKTVLEWCWKMGLISPKHECPECKSLMFLQENEKNIDGYVWVCRQEGANNHFVERSVRKGSFFEEMSNLSLTKILQMTYLWNLKAKPEFVADELDLPLATAEEWLKFCREVCTEICISKNSKLGGEGVLVEITESKFQEKAFRKSYDVIGDWIYVGFEKETDKAFIEIVKERSLESLISVMDKYILPGTILVSDCWELYDCLEEEDFKKIRDGKSLKLESLNIGEIGTSILGLRRCVKISLNNDPRIPTNFDTFLAEYMWRRTHSDCAYTLIHTFLKEIVNLFPPAIAD